MGNSPSKNNSYAIPSTNKNTSTNNASSSLPQDDLNAGEPTEPDDSRSISTQTNNVMIKASNHQKPRKKQPNYDWEIDMSMAKALSSVASSNSNSTVTSGSTMSSVKNITAPSSYTDSSFLYMKGDLSSSPEEEEPSSTPSKNLPPIREENASGIPNHRLSKPVILKKYPHDPSSTDQLNIDDCIEKLLRIGETRYYNSRDFPFHAWEIQLICSKARELFLDQPSLLRLQAPMKIVGDIHGQFLDLLRILKLSGVPPQTSYLFLGDYVDRGKQSLETILLLLCYKVKYPEKFFMLRGNHESANVTKMYGFYDECKRRTSTKCWKMFVDVFNTLPFAAIVNDKIFCVHGGISPQLSDLRQIEKIVRPTDIPEDGLITDLLWSDPDTQISDWALNDRGVSYIFSKRNVYDFCSQFKFDLIIRGHMVVEDGYEFFAKKKFVTVFSAPNYCGEFRNWGAVMSVTTGLMCSFELLKPHGHKHAAK